MIILSTLNARHIHASLGLRYLYANMGNLRDRTALLEFIVSDRPSDLAEAILAHHPKIIGFGVYIWNVEPTTKLVRILKRVDPTIVIVLGGPEVSHETAGQSIVAAADYVILGPGDRSFPALCQAVLSGEPPQRKLIRATQLSLSDIELPYRYYSAQDIAHRLIYVEASRGCPFRCEFCLSSLDERVAPFDLDRFLQAMQELLDRGARHFKFVDRTFNLKVETSLRILEFFLERLDEQLFLHFELVPDRLPKPLKAMIRKFPAGSLQFEIGIQSFDPAVQRRISRRQDNGRSETNLAWLRNETDVHLHVDLIVGLPGESLESFGAGFDRLVALHPHEIQVGLLKRLRGAPIARHTAEFSIVFDPDPPYTILQSRDLAFSDVQRLNRFARYWDLVGNSGRFPRATRLLLGDAPFRRFLAFSDWLYREIGKTHEIALHRLFDAVFRGLTELLGEPEAIVTERLQRDFAQSGLRRIPDFLADRKTEVGSLDGPSRSGRSAARQIRHARQAGRLLATDAQGTR